MRKTRMLCLILALICFCAAAGYAEEAIQYPYVIHAPAFAIEDFVLLDAESTGTEVIALQNRLIQLGYLEGEADGIFGEATQEAVIAFQTGNELEPDGIVSPEMQCVLFNDGAIAADRTVFEAYDPALFPAEEETDEPAILYIGNIKSKKFHYPDCPSVSDMSESNKAELFSRDDAISRGYVPCKRCNP